tara:strand:+ start:5431 stop:5664 length:234 start_codon:yes stop_codon:yes gene_type:complete
MLTEDIKKYRQSYYKNHREYLLNYSKWYYSLIKFRKGFILEEEILKKPIRTEPRHKPKKNYIKGFSREYGKYYHSWD